MKKYIILFLLICGLVCTISSISCAEEIMPYASESIRNTGITISTSGDQVYASAVISATGKASKLGFSEIVLYHKIDGEWEVAASTYDKYGYNLKSYSASVNCKKVPGREYKATCSSMATVKGVSDTGSASVGPVTIN